MWSFINSRKFRVILFLIFTAITFWPLLILYAIVYFIYRKVQNPYVKYGSIAILVFSLIAVAVWIDKDSTNKTSRQQQDVKSEQTKPISPTIPVASDKKTLTFAKVTKVIDGDTIQIEEGKTVRYIGINTPETVDPRKPVECFGKEASEKNKAHVFGKIVGLEKDVSETDRFGRLLRYVYVGETLINEQLVLEGYAFASSYPPDVKYQNVLRKAEQDARNKRVGLWSLCNR